MESKKWKGHLAMLLANIIFGLNVPIAGALMPATIHPFSLTFLRLAGGLLLFGIASLFVKPEKVTTKDKLMLFFASLLALTFNQFPFFLGLSMSSPIDSSIVVTTLPIVTIILAAFILREPITKLKAGGVAVGACGALMLIFQGAWNLSGQGNTLGNLIISVGVLSFSLYLTVFKHLITRYHPVTVMKWMFLYGTMIGFPICYKALAATNFSAFDGSVWLSIVFIVVLATFVGYLLIPVGQKFLRPTTLSMYNYLQPIMATLYSVMLGAETFGWYQAVAAILVFAGVYGVTKSKSRAQLELERQKSP